MARSAEGAILVVDDDPAIRTTITDILELEGYPVAGAANGAEALEQVARGRPGLILLDMRMPVMDGWAFARALADLHVDVRVVVMTAAQSARAWAQEIKADDYLAKPFELDDLLAKVGRLYPSSGAG